MIGHGQRSARCHVHSVSDHVLADEIDGPRVRVGHRFHLFARATTGIEKVDQQALLLYPC